ncbi:hypothetical protein E2562_009576 [Oryza meyeriana var. granulata]|uniref:Uncharacterized protein n=1 Tax=Oryza meyeriana var. granulata TaxID=110450 RepID=A0A6G1F5X4_9ORYZ|nr:hypothetical protein E2562_009576 [Oryza meyeriana var. granulata]
MGDECADIRESSQNPLANVDLGNDQPIVSDAVYRWQPQGVANEGEYIPSVLEVFKREDEEFEKGMDVSEDDSDDEVEGNIGLAPMRWSTDDFSQLAITEDRDAS